MENIALLEQGGESQDCVASAYKVCILLGRSRLLAKVRQVPSMALTLLHNVVCLSVYQRLEWL